jgi:hypothetical protein
MSNHNWSPKQKAILINNEERGIHYVAAKETFVISRVQLRDLLQNKVDPTINAIRQRLLGATYVPGNTFIIDVSGG